MGYWGRLRLLTILEVFRTSAIFLSELIIPLSSINVILALNGALSMRSGLKVLQNFLLSAMLFLSKLLQYFFSSS